VHILPVTFQAGDATGKVERQLKINTDLGEGAVPSVTVQATVEAVAEPQASAALAPAVGQASTTP
jgi:hypothetical protein